MSKLNWKTVLASVVTMTALAWAPPSFAQAGGAQGQGSGPSATQPGGPPAGSMDDATLDKFAGAYAEIQEIHDDYSGRLHEASDQEEAMRLQRDAQREMLEVVHDNDLTVREYNQVATMMNQDPGLRERVNQKIGEQQ